MGGAVRQLVTVWAAMMGLLALTIGAIFLHLGPVLPAISYGIATTKAALVLWFFMEMRKENGIARLAIATGFSWLAILLILTAADSGTRGIIGVL
jgi:cytochrome c oxidase subunit 4